MKFDVLICFVLPQRKLKLAKKRLKSQNGLFVLLVLCRPQELFFLFLSIFSSQNSKSEQTAKSEKNIKLLKHCSYRLRRQLISKLNLNGCIVWATSILLDFTSHDFSIHSSSWSEKFAFNKKNGRFTSMNSETLIRHWLSHSIFPSYLNYRCTFPYFDKSKTQKSIIPKDASQCTLTFDLTFDLIFKRMELAKCNLYLFHSDFCIHYYNNYQYTRVISSIEYQTVKQLYFGKQLTLK